MTNDELRERLKLLRDAGVTSFKDGELEVTLAPAIPARPEPEPGTKPPAARPDPSSVLKAMQFEGLSPKVANGA